MQHRPLLAAALASALLSLPAAAQSAPLAERVAAVRDGTVRLSYEARSGICGDGQTLIGDQEGAGQRGFVVYLLEGSSMTVGSSGTSTAGGDDFRDRCVPGPVRLDVVNRSGRVSELRVYAGGGERGTESAAIPRADRELGRVEGAAAARWLLAVARDGEERVSRSALFAATLADGVPLSAELAALARDRSLRPHVRDGALRRLAGVAAREGSTRQAEETARAIAADAGDRADVRERAIRVLGESPEGAGFLRELYPRLEVPALKERVIRVAAEEGGEANARWMRAIALDREQPAALRDRALRLLGEELGRPEEVRTLYAQLDEPMLKERAIRVVGEQGGSESARWLRAVAEDANEEVAFRERAIRALGERGESAYLRELYPRLRDGALKERVLRMAGEVGSADDLRFLRDVARNEGESGAARDRAVRVAHEAGVASAELVSLYDAVAERVVRERLLSLFAERGDKASTDKLVAVARNDPDAELRRRAVRKLSESGDPRAKELLRELTRGG